MPKMDYRSLLALMKYHGYTQKTIADAIGISESHLCQKLKGAYVFKQTEIQQICNLLSISGDEIGKYFFTPES